MKNKDLLISLKVKVVLEEYKTLRTQIYEMLKLHSQLMYIWTSVLMAVVGATIIYEKYFIFLILPFFSAGYSYRWLWDQQSIRMSNDFILFIERHKIPDLLGNFDDNKKNYKRYLLGCDQYWWENEPKTKNYLFSFVLLFILIPFGSSLVYIYLSYSKIIVSDIIYNLPSVLQYSIYIGCLFLDIIILWHIISQYLKVCQLLENEKELMPEREDVKIL